MSSYSLRQMAERPAGTVAMFPVIQFSPGLERAYLAELRRLLKRTAQGFRDIILPAYKRRLALTTDADAEDFDAFKRFVNALIGAVNSTVADLLKLEGQRHTKTFMEAARRSFGVDLRGIVTEADLEDYLQAAALRNAGLIQGLSDDAVKRIQTATVNAMLNGETVRDLQRRVRKELNTTDARARLIARDQTSKLTAEMNKLRHMEAGVDEYIWRTSQDERVRDRHRRLNNNKYKYGEPTGAEEGLEPGQPVQCRCIAQAVVRF